MVKVGLPRIKLGNAAFPILVLLLFALLVLTYYPLYGPPRTVLGVKDLPNLFVEALHGLNHSSRLLTSIVNGLPVNTSGHIERMRTVAALLINASELPELQGSELGEQLRLAAASYAYSASAAADIASAAEEILAVRHELQGFLEGIRRCDFHKARKSALSLKPALRRALEDLREAFRHLAKVDDGTLLSDNHRRIYSGAVELVSRAAKALENLLAAAELVQLADANELEKACHGDPARFDPEIVEISLKLKPNESGEFGYEVALLKSYVLGAREPQQGDSSGRPGGQGSGAGWGEPQGDD